MYILVVEDLHFIFLSCDQVYILREVYIIKISYYALKRRTLVHCCLRELDQPFQLQNLPLLQGEVEKILFDVTC